MYRDKGKNYWISTEWGNDAFGHKGTRGMVRLAYNLVNRIVFIPAYDLAGQEFPPTPEMIESIENNPKSMLESRICEFGNADLIFYESEERKNTIIPLDFSYVDEKNRFVDDRKVICCLEPQLFHRFTKELRNSQDKIYRNKKSEFPYPLYEEVKEIPVYRFIHEMLAEFSSLLPDRLRKSLEL